MIRRILAVDDEPDMLRLLACILKGRTPYQVETTINALEVPQLLAQTQYDVLITDMRMRGLDGLDILRLVSDGRRQEKVIIITAFGTLENVLEAMSLGAFRYLTKPFRKEDLIAAVDQAMKQQLCEREAGRLSGLLELEPFAMAQENFQRQYVHRLAERCGGDRQLAAQKSGLPPETINTILDS
jgi:DNA-binding NtrC family response regulator